MYEVIGRMTGKIYAEGSKADCNRLLIKKYPNQEGHHYFKGGTTVQQVFPEQLIVRRRNTRVM